MTHSPLGRVCVSWVQTENLTATPQVPRETAPRVLRAESAPAVGGMLVMDDSS